VAGRSRAFDQLFNVGNGFNLTISWQLNYFMAIAPDFPAGIPLILLWFHWFLPK
jgi:hypothetical protein